MNADTVAVGVLSIAVTVATASFYLICFLKPDAVWAINAPRTYQRRWPKERRGTYRWYHVVFVVVAMIGTGVCTNSAILDLMTWMPKTWLTDNGVWLAESTAGLAGITVGFFLPFGTIQMASNLGESRENCQGLIDEIRRMQTGSEKK